MISHSWKLVVSNSYILIILFKNCNDSKLIYKSMIKHVRIIYNTRVINGDIIVCAISKWIILFKFHNR